MKKLLLLLFTMGLGSIAYSQCISGPSSTNAGQIATFTSVASAQCSNCYDWDIVSGNVIIDGSDMNQSISIKPLAAGSFTLSLTYFDETGCHQCNATYTATAAVPMPVISCFGFDPYNNPYDGVTNVGFVNFGVGSVSSVGITFNWTFNFNNGTVLNLTGQNPTFPVICPDNPVVSFMLTITNGVTVKNMYCNYPFQIESRTCFLHPSCGWDGIGKTELQNQELIKVYPNPVKSTINFKGSNIEKYTVSIFDQKGNTVIENQKLDKDVTIENQKPGIYIYVITDAYGYKQEGKLIKE